MSWGVGSGLTFFVIASSAAHDQPDAILFITFWKVEHDLAGAKSTRWIVLVGHYTGPVRQLLAKIELVVRNVSDVSLAAIPKGAVRMGCCKFNRV